MRITWGRIISLFAFAVRLAQEYREVGDSLLIKDNYYLLSCPWEITIKTNTYTILIVFLKDAERVESIVRFLASYVTKHLIPFIRDNGGWVKTNILINNY